MKNIIFFLALLLSACRSDKSVVTPNFEFGEPVKIEIIGYSGNAMEPFISRDGNILLFNNLNSLPENTNLHWATKINDNTFQYKGEIAGVNTTELEGVPTMDNLGNLYFVSLRSYTNTLSTIYDGKFSNGIATNVQLTSGISKLQLGWLNFDIEVSIDGQTIYFADAQFDGSSLPKTADLVIAKKGTSGFQRLTNSNEILRNINSNALEYAACISENQLELYFTRLAIPVTPNTLPEILVSTRQNANEPFSNPSKIQSITGLVEAPTIAPDQKTLYYHKKDNNLYVLYMVKKP